MPIILTLRHEDLATEQFKSSLKNKQSKLSQMLLTGRRQEIIFSHLEKGHKYRFIPDIRKVNWRIYVKNIKSGQLILFFYNIISKRKKSYIE